MKENSKMKKSNKKRNIIIIMIAALITISFIVWRFINFISPTNNELVGEMVNYPLESDGIVLLIPASWNKFTNLSGAGGDKYVIAEFGSNSTKSSIIVEKKAMELSSIKEIEQFHDQLISELTDVKLIDESEKIIGSQKGVLREYTFIRRFVLKDYLAHCYTWLFIYKDYGYVFDLCSDNSIWNKINLDYLKIIESIKTQPNN